MTACARCSDSIRRIRRATARSRWSCRTSQTRGWRGCSRSRPRRSRCRRDPMTGRSGLGRGRVRRLAAESGDQTDEVLAAMEAGPSDCRWRTALVGPDPADVNQRRRGATAVCTAVGLLGWRADHHAAGVAPGAPFDWQAVPAGWEVVLARPQLQGLLERISARHRRSARGGRPCRRT